MARKRMTAEERRRKQAETMKNIASTFSPKRTGTGQGSSGRKSATYTSPKEGDTKIKEGNKFIWKGGKWVKATPSASYKAPKEGDTKIKEGNKFVWKGGKWVKASTTPKPTPKPKPKPTPKPAAKKPAPKPSPKPTPKPTAKEPAYEGPGSRGQAPGGYAGKPKKQSLKSQVEELKKMRMAAEARNKAAAAKKKAEEEEKKKRRAMGSRKPGSMY